MWFLKNLLNETGLIIHELKEPNKWERSDTLIGIMIFAGIIWEIFS